MLLKVYDQYKNPIGYIRNYTDLKIESELESGDKTLSFTYQRKDLKITDEASYMERSSVLGEMALGRAVLGTSGTDEPEYDYLQNECYIETPDDRFVVKEIGMSMDGYPEITCQLDLEKLEADMVENFSAINVSIQDAANLAIVGTGWRANTEDVDPEKLRSVATLKATRLTLLGKIRDAWMCELEYDTKNEIVYFRDQIGDDKGVFFSKQLNLRSLKRTDDSYDYYTRIVPIGEDDLRINDVNDGVGYVENYQYSNKVRTLIWEDTSYTDAQALKDDAEAKLEDMSKPARSYSADIIDLARQKSKQKTVTDTTIGYYKSTSETECIGGEWSTKVPEAEEGYYIWFRLTITYGITTENMAVTTDPICLTALGEDVSIENVELYYSVSESGSWCQPHNSFYTALVGTAIVGSSMVGLSGEWVTDQPKITDDEFLWIGYLITYSNGETIWTESICLTDRYAVPDFGLGDTITLLDANIRDKQRIVKMVEYPDNPFKNSCELSNTTLTWEEMQSKLQAAADAFEDISNADGTVNGYYVHGITSDGVTVLETVINDDGSTSTKASGSLTDNLVTITNNISSASSTASAALDAVITVAGNVISISEEVDMVSARIGTLEVTALTVTEADIRYAKIEDLEATTIEVENLYGLYADIESLIATELVAEIASINDLLAGNIGTGTVQTIHLTADNVTIDDAIITSAMIYDLSADKISSGTIYTDYVKIANNEGQNLWIDGATIQIIDENDIVRVQIGLDESGDYNLYLWNALGELIWNAAGLTEEGLLGNGAIIRNDAVADDANISGYKLDIESVAERLEDGVLVLDAAQVTIDGDTLDYKLTEMTQTIDRIADDSVMSVTNYYALGSADEPPCDPGETIAGAILGEMTLGMARLGFVNWTTERLVASEGEYLWFAQRIEYADGTVTWTTPTLITDDWIRSSVTTMITELSVIQGQIAGKIWESDITEATTGIWETVNSITDSYSELVITIDGITEDVSSINTTVGEHYREMTEEFSSITVELGNITSTVSSVEERVENIESYAVTATTTEYYKSTSPTECIGGQWSTQAPESEEGYYIWMRLTITYGVGATSETVTTDPICLTALGEDISVQSIVPYYSVSESRTFIQPHDTSQATLVGSAIVGTSLVGVTGEWTIEQPDVNEYEYLWMSYLVTYSNGDTTWTDPTCLTEAVVVDGETVTLKESYSQIVQTIDSMTLRVVSSSSDGALGGVASIILDAGGHETETELDLTNVRRAFADDTSAITISAGTILFDSNTILINSDNCILDANGKLSVSDGVFDGTVTSNWGSLSTVITGGYLSVYYKDVQYGRIAASTDPDTGQAGICLIASANSGFLSLGISTDDDIEGMTNSSTRYYTLNAGVNPFGYTERHIFAGIIRSMDPIISDSNIYVANNYSFRGYESNGGSVRMIGINTANQVLISDGGYSTYLYGDRIYIGSGYSSSSLYLSATIKAAIYLEYAYAIRCLTSSGDYMRALYVLNNDTYSNILHIGDPDNIYRLYLYGSTILSSGSIGTMSDRALKHDIETLDDKYIAMLDAIEPVRFKYNKYETAEETKDEDSEFESEIMPMSERKVIADDETTSRYHTGYIAQDVIKAAEDAGLKEDEIGLYAKDSGDGYASLAYEEIIPLLHLKIKQLESRISQLEKTG